METKTRILAADSNKDFCRQLTELIAQEGDMEIVGTASDGVETLALLSEEKPDILLLDLVLPKLDGLEVLRRLPETGAKCRTIVLSGFVNNKVISDCTNYGVDYFMPKPGDEHGFCILTGDKAAYHQEHAQARGKGKIALIYTARKGQHHKRRDKPAACPAAV